MPQLDVSTYFSQVFWLICFFALLYLFVSVIFLPRLLGIIKQRKDLIFITQKDSEQMHSDVQQKIKRHEKVIADAKFAAQNIIQEANKLAQSKRERALAELAKKELEFLQKGTGEVHKLCLTLRDDMKRVAFDSALKAYSCVFGSELKDKNVDFSKIKDFAYSGVDLFFSSKESWQ